MVDSTPLTGTFTATGNSQRKAIFGYGVLSLSGIVGSTVNLQRSTDVGATWGTVKTYTADVIENIFEAETEVFYRLNCSTFGSGTVTYRIAQGSGSFI